MFQVKNLQKKIQTTESAYDVCTEDLFNQVIVILMKWTKWVGEYIFPGTFFA